MESDSRIIIDAMIGTNASPVTIDNIFYGIRQKLRELRNLQLSHVTENCPAHILAHYDKNTDNYVIWIKENPNMIESVLV